MRSSGHLCPKRDTDHDFIDMMKVLTSPRITLKPPSLGSRLGMLPHPMPPASPELRIGRWGRLR